MTPSRGTLRWTLTGPGAGGGQRGRGDPRAAQLAAVGGRDRAGQRLGQDAVADDVDQVPVQPQRDPAAGQLGADLDPVPGQVGDPVGVDGPVDLDHRAAGQGTGLGRAGCRGRRPGRARAAHLQRGQVLGVQAGRHGLDQLPADEHVHGELIGPHVRELPGPLSAQLDPLHRGNHGQHAAGRDHRVELDGSRRLRAEQHRRRPARRLRALAAGPARPGTGSGWVPGRNKLAGVAMPSAWCGRAWL